MDQSGLKHNESYAQCGTNEWSIEHFIQWIRPLMLTFPNYIRSNDLALAKLT